MAIKPQQEEFQLEAEQIGLMTLATAAKSFDVTRQAFHRWGVKPVRAQGTTKLYDLASVLSNRLQHAEADRTPDDAERDRLQSRADLLIEQIEGQRIRNRQARTQYARHEHAEAALRASVDAAGEIIGTIPAAILESIPKASPARKVIVASVDEAVAALQAAGLETPDLDTGTTPGYT